MLWYVLLVLPALCAYKVRSTGEIYGSFEGDAVFTDNSDSDLRIKKREDIMSYPFLATVGWIHFRDFENSDSPWKASCGGTIITNTHILTAAHCVADPGDDKTVGVLLRPHALGTSSIQVGDILTSLSVHIHPNYRLENESGISYPVLNDIAILTLENPLALSDQVSPVCLVSSLDLMDASVTVMMGPGNEHLPVPVLREKLYPSENCVHLWKNLKKMNPHDIFCTRPRSIEICPGEAGGPLVWFNKESKLAVQLGIHSFGNSCKLPDKPKVFAKVLTYIPWIQSVLRSSGEGALRQLCLKQLELCEAE